VGEDPDGYVRTYGAEAMQKILDDALPFHEFFIESLKARHDVTTIRGKEQLLEAAREFYGSVRSSVLREEIDRQIADLVDLSVESVRRELPRRPRARDQEETTTGPIDVHWGVEEHLLALVLRGELKWESIEFDVSSDDFSEANQPIAKRLAGGMTELSELIGELDEEGARRASYYALAPLEIDVDQAIEDAKCWMGSLPAIAERLVAINRDIAASGEAEDWEMWDKLVREKTELRIAWRRAKDATGEGIHEQQDQENRSESEAA
jgi:DNA primase